MGKILLNEEEYGANLLENLENVEISSPTEGQVLAYDETNDIWKNENAGGSGSTNEIIPITSGTGATTHDFSFDKTPKRISVSYNSPDNWYGYWQFLWGDDYVVFSCKAKSVAQSGDTTGMGKITYGADGKSFTITGHNAFGLWN